MSPPRDRNNRTPTRRNRVWLVHSNAETAPIHSRQLAAAGYEVVRDSGWSSPELAKAKKHPPEAVIIDLSRAPSAGRDVSMAIRSHNSMLRIPILLVGGEADAVERLRALVPDAIVTTWGRIEGALARAIANPPLNAVRQSVFAAYAQTPLPKKLGIQEKSAVAVLNMPKQLKQTLGELPDGARLQRSRSATRDLTLWFVKSRDELTRQIRTMSEFAAGGRLWILWPKKNSGRSGDLSQTVVRQAGLASGLVDFKISKIDETWAGLRFTKRR